MPSLTRRHYSGYSGVAYYETWLGPYWYVVATTAHTWTVTCTSFDTYSDNYVLDVNGHAVSGSVASMGMPDQITINSNLPSQNAQWSAFGVAEMLVWDRAISQTELRSVSTYLTTKYGVKLMAPPAPPVPAALPTAPSLPSNLQNGMMAWYNMDGVNASANSWASNFGGGATSISAYEILTDPPGTAANSVPVTYLAGATTTSITFPEQYSTLLSMSVCTVSRYTSGLGQLRQAIFQASQKNTYWLHGHYSGYSGVAYYNGWLGAYWYQLATTATNWVVTCTSFDTGSQAYEMMVNGHPVEGTVANVAVPNALAINSLAWQASSAFGVAELITWNRPITSTELRSVSTYLTTKYGITQQAPPAPPVPAAPRATIPALPAQQQSGIVAWCVTRALSCARALSRWPGADIWVVGCVLRAAVTNHAGTLRAATTPARACGSRSWATRAPRASRT